MRTNGFPLTLASHDRLSSAVVAICKQLNPWLNKSSFLVQSLVQVPGTPLGRSPP